MGPGEILQKFCFVAAVGRNLRLGRRGLGAVVFLQTGSDDEFHAQFVANEAGGLHGPIAGGRVHGPLEPDLLQMGSDTLCLRFAQRS